MHRLASPHHACRVAEVLWLLPVSLVRVAPSAVGRGTGRGVRPDRAEAHKLFSAAAAAGHEPAIAALREVQGMDT